jgi:phosphoribosylformylglycinamidine synthase
VPVVSGNVSLYNETDGAAIYPTAVVGALGLLEDVAKVVPSGFPAEGEVVYLAGPGAEAQANGVSLRGEAADLAGSEYLRQAHGLTAGRPRIDLALEARLQRFLVAAADAGLLRAAHDCSQGGLAVALAEACLARGVGFAAEAASIDGRLDAALFGEAASRAVLSVAPGRVAAVEALLNEIGLPFARLGSTGGAALRLPPYLDAPLASLGEAYETGLAAALGA